MNPSPPTGSGWGNVPPMGAINNEESKEMTRNRQYGYAIMACAVVALALLMVSFRFLFKAVSVTTNSVDSQTGSAAYVGAAVLALMAFRRRSQTITVLRNRNGLHGKSHDVKLIFGPTDTNQEYYILKHQKTSE